MAEVFQRASVALPTTDEALVYQAPNNQEADRAISLSCLASNVDGDLPAEVSLILKTANNVVLSRTAYRIQVPARATLEMLPNRVVLKRGDKVFAQASLGNRIEVTFSALEITPNVS
jgi:hypothetical protein